MGRWQSSFSGTIKSAGTLTFKLCVRFTRNSSVSTSFGRPTRGMRNAACPKTRNASDFAGKRRLAVAFAGLTGAHLQQRAVKLLEGQVVLAPVIFELVGWPAGIDVFPGQHVAMRQQ